MGVKIPTIGTLPPSTLDPKKNVLDVLGDHLNTCITHSGDKKAHDWTVEQITDLFHATHKVKTHQVVRTRGQWCGDIEPSHRPPG